MNIRIIRDNVSLAELKKEAGAIFGDFVKAVVDLDRHIMAIGGELHADGEAVLLDDGSIQQNLWGINIYPEHAAESMIEFDSMINIRPSQANRSRDVEDPVIREKIIEVVRGLIV